jgi:cytochrome oxidase Cu insertion factor (SCO1/SenC/PrrC family)
MPGMNTGLNTNDPTVVSRFNSTLLHQGILVFLILLILAVAWNALRTVQYRRAVSLGETSVRTTRSQWPYPEPIGRRTIRIGFGLIWIFDGILQGQSSMPLGMTTQVIQPTAASSPSWVQHIVNVGGTIWSNHPIAAPASAVWIQVGIGVWLLAGPRGNWSRAAGLVSAGWGLVVWIFGESFGGIFAPGLTWAFGAPGAVLFYSFAGLLLALPERSWTTPRLGRVVLAVMGLFFIGMAVLQAWPGRGFWQGHIAHSATPGTLTGMVHQMAQTPQPGFLSSWLSSFASFDAAHGWGVNLFLVVSLAAIGLLFVSGRAQFARVGVVAGIVLCLADWVLVEDLGFLGGVGTDLNSMIPMALIFVGGYLAMTRVPHADVPLAAEEATEPRPSWAERVMTSPGYSFRALAALGALAIVLVGAVPMAAASTNPNADPIVAQAVDGSPNITDRPTPPFQLVDQRGAAVSLHSLHGKTVVLAFLDPVCVSDCPLIAQELRQADDLLGGAQSHVDFVAVNLNPLYTAPQYLVAFDRQEDLSHLANWLYLTGSVEKLKRVWSSFGVLDEYSPAGAMIAHSDVGYVIDANGDTREILNTDPGPGTATTESSFAATIVNAVDTVSASS